MTFESGSKKRVIQIVVLGATGKYALTKIFPSLFRLYSADQLPTNFLIIGASIEEIGKEEFFAKIEEELSKNIKIQFNKETWGRFIQNVDYLGGDLFEVAALNKISTKLLDFDTNYGESEKSFILATPESSYQTVLEKIEQSELSPIVKQNKSKLLVPKPFGNDVESESTLNNLALGVFGTERSETEEGTHFKSKVYRVDDFVPITLLKTLKDTVSTNPILSTLINSNQVEQIQVAYFESSGVGERGSTFDRNGVSREMLQSRVLPIIAEIMHTLDFKESLVDKADFINALSPIEKDQLIIGQYTNGINEGKILPSYQSEPGVDHSSRTATYLAFRSEIKGKHEKIPLYVRVGKRLRNSITEIIFIFKKSKSTSQNILSLRIHPIPGIYLTLTKGSPESTAQEKVVMEYTFKQNDKKELESSNIFDKQLYRAIVGKSEGFTTYEEAIEAWRFTDKIKLLITDNQIELETYPAGSWGPERAKALIAEAKQKWYTEEYFNICKE